MEPTIVKLYRELTMVGVVQRIAVRYGSHASRKLNMPEKIPVQLLKDVKSIGVKGQVINVRPAFMRNFLHVDNKATYILKGQTPPLPVVAKQQVIQQTKVAPKPIKVETKTKEKAMSLEELSSLFTGMSTKNKKSASFSSMIEHEETVADYSISELKQAIPSVYTITTSEKVPLPITINYISDVLFNLSGVKVPSSAIQVSLNKNIVKSIEKVGKYSLVVSKPLEKSSLSTSIIVK